MLISTGYLENYLARLRVCIQNAEPGIFLANMQTQTNQKHRKKQHNYILFEVSYCSDTS